MLTFSFLYPNPLPLPQYCISTFPSQFCHSPSIPATMLGYMEMWQEILGLRHPLCKYLQNMVSPKP